MIDDDTFNNFSKYLLDLGFLNKSAYDEFSKKYEEISQRKLYSSSIVLTDSIKFWMNKTYITDTIVEFYSSLKEEKKKLLAINVYDKFIKKSEKYIKFEIIEHKHVESFNIPGIKNNKICIHCQKPKIVENDKKTELNEENNKNKIKNKSFSKGEKKVSMGKQKMELNEDIKSQQVKGNIFRANSLKIKSKLIKKNFEERLKYYEKAKEEKKQNRIKEEEKQFKKKFPFTPKRNNSTNRKNDSTSKYNIHPKLYEDNARKKEKQNENFNKIMKEIKISANHRIIINSTIDYIKKMKNEKYENLKKSNKMNNMNNISTMKNKEVKVSSESNKI
jgi:hypothetical protein